MQSQGGGRDSAVAFAPHSSCSSLLLEQQSGRAAGKEGWEVQGAEGRSLLLAEL